MKYFSMKESFLRRAVTRERVSRIVWITGERLKSRSRPLSYSYFSLQLRAHVETGSYLHATVMIVID